MRIRFHDPLDRVTGSCYELHDPALNVRFLVDCGMRQGEHDAEEANRGPLPFDASALDFVVLTHAHVDHCGLIPRLYREGFRGPVHCTRETAALAGIVLTDVAKRPDAPFEQSHVDCIKWHEHGKALFGSYLPVHRDVYLQYMRAAHLAGAVSVTVTWGPRPKSGETDRQRRITFSGDLGPNGEGQEHQPLMRRRMDPAPSDYAVVESTYGGVARPPELRDPEARLERLRDALDNGLSRGGPVVIPCFALGRTQDVLFDLHALFARYPSRYAEVPVYFDGPMAQRANRVYARALGRTYATAKSNRVKPAWLARAPFALFGLDPEDAADTDLLLCCLHEMLLPDYEPRVPRRDSLVHWRRIWQRVGDRLQVNGSGIVVTGGGMCEGGPVNDYLRRLAAEPSTTVLLTGYCGPSTVGGRLQRLAGMPAAERTRLQTPLGLGEDDLLLAAVRAHIHTLSGYSAHADEADLLAWLFPAGRPAHTGPAGRTVFITHGDAERRRALDQAVRARARAEDVNVTIELPGRDHGWFDLDAGQWDIADRSDAEVLRAQVEALQRQVAALQRGARSE